MEITQINEWFNRFKNAAQQWRVTIVMGATKPARNAAALEKVKNLVKEDRPLTVRETAEEVGISKDSAHPILRIDLNLRRVATKFVPKRCGGDYGSERIPS